MLQFFRSYPNLFTAAPEIGQPPVAQMDPTLAEPNTVIGQPSDAPTIGLILCQGKANILAEYALRGIDKPIGIASYELTRALPESLQSALPSIESIEAELSGLASENESDGSA
jgi:hypothetical protein